MPDGSARWLVGGDVMGSQNQSASETKVGVINILSSVISTQLSKQHFLLLLKY